MTDPNDESEKPVAKPLEWNEPSQATNGCWTAKSALGTYSVVNEGGWYASRDDTPRDFYFEWCGQDMSRDTLDTAKAAAQADYEQRIRSALAAPRPSPVSPEVEGLVTKLTNFRIGTEKRYYETGDMWFFELFHALDDAIAAIAQRDLLSGEVERLRELLGDARFAIETTLVCLNTWNGNRGGPADCEGIIARIEAALQKGEHPNADDR